MIRELYRDKGGGRLGSTRQWHTRPATLLDLQLPTGRRQNTCTRGLIMSLIYAPDAQNGQVVTAVVCDRCGTTVREPLELQECVRVSLRPGYGSIWGDGNHVEADLCQACGHELFASFARVSEEPEIGNVAIDLTFVERLSGCLPSSD